MSIFRSSFEVVHNPLNDHPIPMTANAIVITEATEEPTDNPRVMIVINNRMYAIRPVAKTNGAMTFIQLIVGLLRQPVHFLDTFPSGHQFLFQDVGFE